MPSQQGTTLGLEEAQKDWHHGDEKQRLHKELQSSNKDISFLEKRLSNPKYVAHAPQHLVQETRDKLAEAIAKRDALDQARQELG